MSPASGTCNHGLRTGSIGTYPDPHRCGLFQEPELNSKGVWCRQWWPIFGRDGRGRLGTAPVLRMAAAIVDTATEHPEWTAPWMKFCIHLLLSTAMQCWVGA